MEDLFDLTLAALNSMYKDLARQKGDDIQGLLDEPTAETKLITLKMEIIKDVVETKQAENAARKAAADRKAQKKRILEIMASKQDAALQDLSLEELQAMLDES